MNYMNAFLGLALLGSLFSCGGGGSAPPSTPPPTPAPTYTAFAESGSMSTNRLAFGAARLADGRVLVSGGYDSMKELDTAELFNPTGNGGAGSFTSLSAKMTVTRYRHTATLLANGQVLITGGRDATFAPRNTAELFDPATNGGAGGFQTLAHQMTVPRAEHVAVALNDGRVLLVGGSSGNITNSAEIFDPATGTFTATDPLHYVRIHHTLTVLVNGKVLVTGGDQGGSGVSAELFDPSGSNGKGSFSDVPPMSVDRYFHQASRLKNGQVLIAGGSNNGSLLAKTDLFDPAAHAGASGMTPAVDMSAGRALHTMTPIADGRCLIAGGTVSSATLDSHSTEWFDPTLNAGAGGFQPGPRLIYARSGHQAVLLSDQTILILGGGDLRTERLH